MGIFTTKFSIFLEKTPQNSVVHPIKKRIKKSQILFRLFSIFPLKENKIIRTILYLLLCQGKMIDTSKNMSLIYKLLETNENGNFTR